MIYLNDLVIIIGLEHRPGESLNVDVRFFHLDIAIEVCQVFGFHLHAFEDCD